jgi:hypothetical protein
MMRNQECSRMPIHDWTKAPAGYFHHFHQRWAGAICDALNAERLPRGYFALVEQRDAAGTVPDVLTLRRGLAPDERPDPRGSLAVATAPPRARFISQATDEEVYAARANRVVVRDSEDDRVVSVIEVVSPGNKVSRSALRAFAEKAAGLLYQGVNVLVIDLFPPTRRDPHGIHKVIWDEVHEEPFELPRDKPLTLASYSAAPPTTAYVEPVAVGDAMPDCPAFLDARNYVPVPLEQTYQATWTLCPEEFRTRVAGLG